MKKMRVAALILSAVILGAAMVSCGNKAEKVSVKSTISVVVDGETKFGPVEVVSEGTAEAVPTVLQAAQEAFIANEVPYEVTDTSLKSVTLDGTVYAGGSDAVNIYTWLYTINGEEPEAGRASTIAVNEGDDIVFNYDVRPINPEDITPTGGDEE